MSCVWDALRKVLKVDSKITSPRFLEWIQLHNALTIDVSVNDEKVTSKQMEENFMRISALDKDDINKGYDCSSADPLLILVCQLFKTTIIHKYLKAEIVYKHRKYNDKTIFVFSDTGHFWC